MRPAVEVADILVRAAAETLRLIAAFGDLRGRTAATVPLTPDISAPGSVSSRCCLGWGQTLNHHPHLHCIVAGGGPSPDGSRRVACRPDFFLPARVLSRLFRRLFLEALRAAFEVGQLQFFGEIEGLAGPPAFARILTATGRRDRVVHAKPPFGGPEQVLACLSRYTHRIAIANSRLIGMEGGRVSFRWRDYRRGRRPGQMILDAGEFIRRFLPHTLPDGVHRIRHFGFLANGQRAARLTTCRALLAAGTPEAADRVRPATSPEPVSRPCPCCGRPMVTRAVWYHGQASPTGPFRHDSS